MGGSPAAILRSDAIAAAILRSDAIVPSIPTAMPRDKDVMVAASLYSHTQPLPWRKGALWPCERQAWHMVPGIPTTLLRDNTMVPGSIATMLVVVP